MDALFYRDLAVKMDHKGVLLAGCGYVGSKLAEQLNEKKYRLTVIVKTGKNMRASLPLANIVRIDLDQDHGTQAELDYRFKTIFYFIPPPAHGITDPRIERFLQSIPRDHLPDKIILISTTGVYGDCGDDWVDESREPAPDTDRARRRLAAEQSLSEWCNSNHVSYIILRVPGIYGPGKLPVERLQQGKPVLKLAESPWSNRIHIDDLVQACIKAMDYSGNSTVFNISDGHPSSMSDFFIKVAKRLGLPEPVQLSLEECKKVFSENMISYLIESKKIVNDRMLNDLDIKLKYPTLEHGLSTVEM